MSDNIGFLFSSRLTDLFKIPGAEINVHPVNKLPAGTLVPSRELPSETNSTVIFPLWILADKEFILFARLYCYPASSISAQWCSSVPWLLHQFFMLHLKLGGIFEIDTWCSMYNFSTPEERWRPLTIRQWLAIWLY